MSKISLKIKQLLCQHRWQTRPVSNPLGCPYVEQTCVHCQKKRALTSVWGKILRTKSGVSL